MTGKQQKALFKSLPPMYKRGELTKEQQEQHEILSCIKMIDSCLIYGGDFWGKYWLDYIKTLGKTKVKKLYEEQQEDFKKSEIVHAGEDSEGGTYFWIKRRDEN